MRLSKKQKKTIYYRIHFTPTSSIWSWRVVIIVNCGMCRLYWGQQSHWLESATKANKNKNLDRGRSILYPMPIKISSTTVVQLVVRMRGVVSLNLVIRLIDGKGDGNRPNLDLA